MTRMVVLVKQVPEPGTVTMDRETGRLVRGSAPAMLNPYCENALELGLQLMDENDELIAISMGPPATKAALRRCLELGATGAVLLADPGLAGSDARATAIALAAAIRSCVPDVDLVLTGKQAMDGDTAQVPGMLAEVMGLPVAYDVIKATWVEDGIEVMRSSGEYMDRLLVPAHSLLAVGRGSMIRRLPSISDLLRSRELKVSTISLVDIGLTPAMVGSKGSATRVVRLFSPEVKRKGIIIMNVEEGAAMVLEAAHLDRGEEAG